MHNPRPEDPVVGLYPMRLVTRLTGLSADTIRAWERRHGAVRPSRSSGNTRRFTADEVRRLVLLREATEGGHSIRSIAPLGLHELERLVDRRELPLAVVPATDGAAGGVSFHELRHAYLGALARFDTRRSFDLLMRGATFLDRHTFVYEVVLPVLRDVEERWARQAVGTTQSQIITGQLHAVLMALLRLSPPAPRVPRLMLTGLQSTEHTAHLLVAGLLATAHGQDPVYLGPGLPASEIEWAVRMSRADVLILSSGGELSADDLDWLSSMTERLRPNVQVWCSIPSGHPLQSAVPLDLYVDSIESLDSALKGLSVGS